MVSSCSVQSQPPSKKNAPARMFEIEQSTVDVDEVERLLERFYELEDKLLEVRSYVMYDPPGCPQGENGNFVPNRYGQVRNFVASGSKTGYVRAHVMIDAPLRCCICPTNGLHACDEWNEMSAMNCRRYEVLRTLYLRRVHRVCASSSSERNSSPLLCNSCAGRRTNPSQAAFHHDHLAGTGWWCWRSRLKFSDS